MDKKFVMSIAAMAALTLVSCSSDDLDSFSDNSSKNEAISFDGYLGRSAVAVNGTRGSEVKIGNLQNSAEGFGVFGYYNNSTAEHSSTESFNANLFNNQQVKYSSTDNKWAYENTKYWPTEGHIDFLAYAPYNAGTFENIYHLTFKVSEAIDKQIDLLYAKADGQTKDNISQTENKVNFHFAHALSRLGYTAKLKEASYESVATITLNKITLAGSTTDPAKGAFYTKGTIDLSKTSSENPWTALDTDKKLKFEWFSDVDKTDDQKTLSNNKAIKNSDDEYLFVIPQDFSTGADELYVIVEYTIKYTSGSAQPTVSYKVFKKLEKNFLQGKAYTINLTIGLTPIEFNADVNAWDEGDKDYNITLE